MRRTSIIRHANWLDVARDAARHPINNMRDVRAFLLSPWARREPNFPKCVYCGVLCDSVEIVNETRTSITILAKHHGKEDAMRIDFDSEPEQEDLNRALRACLMFRTDSQLGAVATSEGHEAKPDADDMPDLA